MSDTVEEKQAPIIVYKRCQSCSEDKLLEEGFYRAGTSWQKLCKPCHNQKRKQYPFKPTYIRKPNGYQRLEPAVKDNIENMLKEHSVRAVALSNGIKYQTLLNWKKRGWLNREELAVATN